jgi:enamine deaminase RidA (YjgF/YER057c/UK114 family)
MGGKYMTPFKYIKYVILLCCILSTLAFMNGCGTPSQDNQDVDYLRKMKEVTDALDDEDVVLHAQVTRKDDLITVAVILKDDADKEKAKKLMEEYAEKFRQLNPERTVNLQAIQNGEQVVNILYERTE